MFAKLAIKSNRTVARILNLAIIPPKSDTIVFLTADNCDQDSILLGKTAHATFIEIAFTASKRTIVAKSLELEKVHGNCDLEKQSLRCAALTTPLNTWLLKTIQAVGGSSKRPRWASVSANFAC